MVKVYVRQVFGVLVDGIDRTVMPRDVPMELGREAGDGEAGYFYLFIPEGGVAKGALRLPKDKVSELLNNGTLEIVKPRPAAPL